jgi:hypothetical protein
MPILVRITQYRAILFLALVIALLSATGCTVLESDGDAPRAERTLPEALDVRRVSLQDARQTVQAPDTVNVEAYVVDYAICPQDANCFLPDGIIIAERPNPSSSKNTRRISMTSPRQFERERRYVLSVRVFDPPDRNLDERALHLIGYSLLE